MWWLDRSERASPYACWTWGLDVSRPYGVFTGSLAEKGWLQGPSSRARARSQKSRKSTSPREPAFSRSFQRASTVQESPTAMGAPEDVGAIPPGKDLHIETSSVRTSSAPYCRSE